MADRRDIVAAIVAPIKRRGQVHVRQRQAVATALGDRQIGLAIVLDVAQGKLHSAIIARAPLQLFFDDDAVDLVPLFAAICQADTRHKQQQSDDGDSKHHPRSARNSRLDHDPTSRCP